MKPKGRTRTESLVCLLVALATLMSPWDLWAQQTAGSESSGDDACLWVVPGKENLVFLGGSVHLLRKTDHPLPPAYAEAYEQSESVYFEVDLQEMQTPAFQRKSAELTRLPEGQTLSEIISEEVHSALRDFLTSRSLEAAAFEQMRPGMLAMVLSSVEAMRMGVQPQWGVEAKFDRQARKDGKPIHALETAAFQISLFAEMPMPQQEELLVMTLDQMDETGSVLEDMIDVWKKGDVEGLDELLNKYFEEESFLTNALLYERNANWIPAIEKELRAKDNVLILVGAGHLVGEKSVIEMLQEKGHEPLLWRDWVAEAAQAP